MEERAKGFAIGTISFIWLFASLYGLVAGWPWNLIGAPYLAVLVFSIPSRDRVPAILSVLVAFIAATVVVLIATEILRAIE